MIELLNVLIQFVQCSTDGSDYKTGKGAVFSLNCIFYLFYDIGGETDRFVNSRRILRNLKLSHKQHLALQMYCL